MSTEFAIADVPTGKLNALVKNIMCQTGETDPNNAVRLINSGEWVISKMICLWREEDGVIYLPPFTSDGTTGEGWIPRLESKGFCVGDYAMQILQDPRFKPSKPGTVIKAVILKGMLFEDNERITSKICAYAEAFKMPDGRKLLRPNAELACLICENFADREIKAMGLWRIATMHESINDSDGNPRLLGVECYDSGRWLQAFGGGHDFEWLRNRGFAFAMSQS